MRRVHAMRPCGLIILVLFIHAAAPNFVTAQVQGLEWGVNIGEEFFYALQRRAIDPAWEEIMTQELPFVANLSQGQLAIVSITELEPIPDVLENGIPLAFCSVRRENDSTIILSRYHIFVVPVGNWALLTEKSGYTSVQGVTIIDDQSDWGIISSVSFDAGGLTVSAYQEIRYEKENGTLRYLRMRYSVYGTDLVDIVFVQWHTGMPTVLPPEFQMTNLLIIIVAGIGGVAVGLVLYGRRRKPLVQILGE
ncbi:MAG: hypothetical protein QXS20_07165 [Candidatus Thorarchaeota archaeon]